MNYDPIPEFRQYVEYITQAEPVGDFCGVIINRVDIAQLPVVEAAETIKADYEKVSALRPLETLAAEKVEAVKAEVCKKYHADVAAYITLDADPLHIVECIAEVKSYPEWKPGLAVKAEDGDKPAEVYLYKTNLWRVLQDHTTQADWAPDVAVSLFAKFYDPAAGPQPWEQPESTNPYQIGDFVTYKGHLWRCKIKNNVWSPDAYPAGWEDLGVYP